MWNKQKKIIHKFEPAPVESNEPPVLQTCDKSFVSDV